ncbi:unnamed protein product [Plutella xylostella]|uniref:Acyl-coenzyme A oxidase n=2 Tax=Plutella xylostella TaxID=51655 RepID=A0A8S4EQD8_PLUXY|nr:unnamed protein product [Plutella xylostella]
MGPGKVNEDLVAERRKCTFDTQELTYIIDGGKEETQKRHEVENIVTSIPELQDPIPEEYMSHKEKYENAVRRACYVTKALKNFVIENATKPGPSNRYRSAEAATKDVTPMALHFSMFLPTLLGQASPEQQEKWVPRAVNMEIIGTYAQTELGHGTFLRGLETTATYDPTTEEFVLNSPTLTAYKWWPGGLAHTANHCVVVAQLHSKGVNHGVHPFIVQIRDEDTHMPLPGVKVGEIGPKLSFSTANNGFLGFDNFRVPRDAMLMKNAQVLKDGTYVKSRLSKLTYGTMVFIRVMIVTDMAYYLSVGATIAIRYSAVRHQSKPKENEPEPQILDYVTQQHKLFIALASSHAFRVTGQWLWTTFVKVNKALTSGNADTLPELHAVACCLKAVTTRDAASMVEACRMSCGGHGYMTSSYLPILYGITTAACTYEGENTVLLLQTARFLVKAWEQAVDRKAMTPTVAYLVGAGDQRGAWSSQPSGITRGMQQVAAGRVRSAVEALQKHVKSGMAYEDAWNAASVQLVAASEAHCRAVLCEVYWTETERLAAASSRELGAVLKQLAELYLVYWALEKGGDLLLYSNISKTDIAYLRDRYEELLSLIRPNAVGLVDAFDIRDEILHSTLGAYDGRVYERLMEEALKSPLNAEPVNQSFHKYLKPFMQGKL